MRKRPDISIDNISVRDAVLFASEVYERKFEEATIRLGNILQSATQQAFAPGDLKEVSSTKLSSRIRAILVGAIDALISDPQFSLNEGGIRMMICLKSALKEIYASSSHIDTTHFQVLLSDIDGSEGLDGASAPGGLFHAGAELLGVAALAPPAHHREDLLDRDEGVEEDLVLAREGHVSAPAEAAGRGVLVRLAFQGNLRAQIGGGCGRRGSGRGVRGRRGRGVRGGRGLAGRLRSIRWDRGGHFVDAHGSQLRERTGREGERSVQHCIDFQNLVARGSLFACGWGQITHRLASYGRLGHPGHLFCARAWSV